MPGRPPGRAFPDGITGDDGGVGRAAGQYDIGTAIQGGDKGFYSQCRDNVFTAVHRCILQLGMRRERFDTTFGIELLDDVLVLLTVDSAIFGDTPTPWRFPRRYHGSSPD